MDICPELPYPTRDQILQRICGVDGVLWCSKEKVDSEMLNKAGKNNSIVKLICDNFGSMSGIL